MHICLVITLVCIYCLAHMLNTVFSMGSNASYYTHIASGIACLSIHKSFSNCSLVLLEAVTGPADLRGSGDQLTLSAETLGFLYRLYGHGLSR